MQEEQSQESSRDPAQSKKQQKETRKAEKLAKFMMKQAQPASVPKQKAPTTKGYDPAPVEAHWMAYWREHDCFAVDPASSTSAPANTFCMVLPPPNITGSLHIGHAMMIAIQDAIARYKRQTGHEVLFLPGLDHAGIATQNVVMKTLDKPGREAFLEAAHLWSKKYGDRILDQMNRLGCSLDYGHKRFTMDEKASASVTHAFVELHRRGLIYRANKMVNWCGRLKTTLSDLEVDYKTVRASSWLEVDGDSHKFGMMYYVRYYLTRDGEPEQTTDRPYVIIGTTRPETILGDSAICINPSDSRFDDIDEIFRNGAVEDVLNGRNRKGAAAGEAVAADAADGTSEALEGLSINSQLKTERKNKYKMSRAVDRTESREGPVFYAINPLTGERLPAIFDEKAEMAFGTGILKVTPCHDPVDFELGRKHGLAMKNVMDESNTIVLDGSKYAGLRRFEARRRIVEDLRAAGHLHSIEDYEQVIPFCSRSGDIVEPMLREQWWLNCSGMAARAVEGVRSGEIAMRPEEARTIWYRWLSGARDWCLSRQLWWGHRMPAYRPFRGGEPGPWIVARSAEEALSEATQDGYDSVQQDEDVLDTWFSSGLWPFSALGWPERTPTLCRFFPNSLLETGSDILFFWVARMVMLSYELCGSRPFDSILLHGIVRDAHGRKMSKSLGNVVDPLYVIEGISLADMEANLKTGNLDKREIQRATDALRRDYPNGIPKCGADALRFTLLSYSNGMRDINLDILRVQGSSRLCNKLFNAFLFIKNKLSASETPSTESSLDQLITTLPLLDHQKWILSLLNSTIDSVHQHMQSYNFMAATQSIHLFFLYDFCDFFIEISKSSYSNDSLILLLVFTGILKIFHPYMPFITEDLHYQLTGSVIRNFPSKCPMDLSSGFSDIIAVVKICRASPTRVEDGEHIKYIRPLVKDGLVVVQELDKYDQIGSIRYSNE